MKRFLNGLKFVIPTAFVFMMVFILFGNTVLADEAKHNNIGDHNYSNWSSPALSYITPVSGGYMIFDALSYSSRDGYLVEYYDGNYNFVSSKTVAVELPIFGAFYSDGSNYYLLTGQENTEESATREVYRVTKYSTDWSRISSVSLKDCNTTIPFDAGGADMISYGNTLFIRTCHEMYTSSDGYNHQANLTMLVDTSAMTILDSFSKVWNSSGGYCSHSFNQYVALDGSYFIGADHGDAHPRGIMVTRYNNAVASGSLSGVNVYFPYNYSESDTLHYNYTGANVGGLGVSSSSYLVAGNSINQADFDQSKTKNIMIAVVNKSTGTTGYKMLTSNTEGETSCGNPFLVKVNDGRFLVLWSKGDVLQYAFTDGDGNLQGSIYSAEGMISDCRPVMNGGKAVWYTYDGNQMNFFEINTSTGEFSSKNPIDINRVTFATVPSQVFTGAEIKPDINLTFGGRELVKNVDYSVEYTNNINRGTAKAVVTGIGKFNGSKTVSFSITPKNIQELSADQIPDMEYTGYVVTPDPVITYGKNTLVKGTDYGVSTSDTAAVGQKTITVSGRGNYTGSISLTFNVVKKDVKNLEYSSITDKIYTGSAITPSLTVRNNGKLLYKDTDYTLEYQNNTAIGKATVVVSGINNFKGNYSISFNINPKPISNVSLSYTSYAIYTGEQLKPEFSLKDGGVPLTEGTDFTAEYFDNVNVGKGRIVVTGTGIYGGTREISFTVTARSLSATTIVLDGTSFVYTGSEIKPSVTVKFDSKTLVENTDYEITYSDNVEIGRYATVTLTGKGNFTGTSKKYFTIQPISLNDFEFSGIPDCTYTGEAIKPAVTVQNGSSVLTEGTDYQLSYGTNISAGQGRVTVTGKGNYTGSKILYFNILPKDVSGLVFTYSKSETYTRYTITPKVTVKDGTKELSTYDYGVSYSNNINAGKGTITVTGKNNYTGTKNLTFTIKPIQLSETEAALGKETAVFTGDAITPLANILWNNRYLTSGTDYRLSYKNNINAGTAKVTAEGLGNFEGTVEMTFKITPADIGYYATIPSIPGQTYTGAAITPDVEIKRNTKKLVNGTDYKIQYGSNTNAGSATVTVTGINNYSGSVTKYFTISRKNIAEADLSIERQGWYYTGKAVTPKVVAKIGNKVLQEDKDYTLSYYDNVNIGKAAVTVSGTGNCYGTAEIPFEIMDVTPKITLKKVSEGVRIRWTEIEGAAKYRVFRKNAEGGWDKISTLNALEYIDKTALPVVENTYTVRVMDESGKLLGEYGDGKTITFVGDPMEITLENKAAGILVSWEEVNGAAKYRVFRKSVGGTSWDKLAVTTSLRYSDKKAVFGETYLYSVRAMTASGEYINRYGTGTEIKYQVSAPKLTLGNTESGIGITWKAMTNAAKYRVYVKDASGNWKRIAIVSGLSATDTAVLQGEIYTYSVVGLDAAGHVMNENGEGYSITRNNAFVNVDAECTTSGLNIFWDAFEGAEKYRVYRKNLSGKWTKLATVSELSYLDADAEVNAGNTYAVLAIDADGNILSDYGNGKTVSFVIPATPTVATMKSGGVRLDWEPIVKAAKYKVFRKTKSTEWAAIGTTAGLSYTDKSAESGKTYYYAVVALNEGGETLNECGDGIKIKFTATSTAVNVPKSAVCEEELPDEGIMIEEEIIDEGISEDEIQEEDVTEEDATEEETVVEEEDATEEETVVEEEDATEEETVVEEESEEPFGDAVEEEVIEETSEETVEEETSGEVE